MEKNYNYYLDAFKKIKGKAKEQITNTFVMKETEYKIVQNFCEENNIKISELMFNLLMKDGVFCDGLILAFQKSYPKSKIFHKFQKDFTYNYKKKYIDKNWDEIFFRDDKKNVTFSMKYVLKEVMVEHYKNLEYGSFTAYIKELINNEGIYPVGVYDALKPYIRTDFIINPDAKHLRDLESDRKRQAKRRTRRMLDMESEKKSVTLAFSISEFEKKEILDPFLKYLKQNNLSFSKLCLYEFTKNKLIKKSESGLTKQDIENIEKLDYKEQSELPYLLSFENGLKVKQKRKTIMIVVPVETGLKEKTSGILGTWIKHYVLKKYNVYPVRNNEDISKLFINQNKLHNIKI